MKLRFAPHISFGGLSAPLFIASGGEGPLQQVEWLHVNGFCAVQDPLAAGRPVDVQQRIGDALRDFSMDCGSFVYAPTDRITSDWVNAGGAAADAVKREIDSAIEIGQRIGSRHIAILARRDDEFAPLRQRANLAANLFSAGEQASAAGMVLCIEPVNARRLPMMLLHHISDGYELVKQIGSPSVRLIFDTGHVQAMDGDILYHLDACWDAIEVIQLADNPGRVQPGAGELNFANILIDVTRRGYTGLLELEHFWAKPGLDAERRGLATLAELDRTVGQALSREIEE